MNELSAASDVGMNVALLLAATLYGDWHIDGHAPETDADMLLAVAAKLDELDDITDAGLRAKGSTHRVERTVQADLRRIAATLRTRVSDA